MVRIILMTARPQKGRIARHVHSGDEGLSMKKRNVKLHVCIILLFFVALSFVFTGRANAKERIVAYDVTAELLEDSSLRITEHIRVTIEHVTIKHGIYRVIPRSQKMANGGIQYHDYEFESVTLDGEPVDYAEAAQNDNVAIAIGSGKEKAPLGEHVYAIRYRTTNHVRFFEERDEIYLNVTGNDWKLPMDAVSFTFIVPGGVANILETTAVTGARGERGGDFVVEGKNVFRTTRPFAVGEGLTVAVAWKKGLVTPPSVFRIGWIADNQEVCFLALLGLIVLYYCLNRRRLQEHVPPVIPLFSAPEGMSPGYVSALKDKGDTGRILQADIMGAAVNGFLRLDMKDVKNIVLHEQEPEKRPKEWMEHYCHRVVSTLTSPENPCDLKTKQGKIQAGKTHKSLQTEYERQQKGLWRDNLLIKIAGWVATFILACGMSLAVDYQTISGESKGERVIPLVVFYFFVGLGLYCSHIRREKCKGLLARGSVLFLNWILFFFGLVMAWPILDGNAVACVGQIVMFCAVAFFMGRVPNPSRTPKAMEPYAQILGLEMYIRTAEQHRLAMINAPEDTVEKYEEILPYAIALGCADAWQKRFDTLLRDSDYAPAWVQHDLATEQDCLGVVGTVATTTAMAVAIDACVAAYHTESRSSSSDSGFSSDSDSGGGSGGGGGGGW